MSFARAIRPVSAAVLATLVFAAGPAAPTTRGADAAPAAGVPSAAAATSAADVQALIDAANFGGAVSAASRLIAKAGSATGPDADKAQLYALKGEAQLHLKQWSQASDAFAKAGKAATDPAVAATDTATALLVKKSPGGTYKPKQPAADGTKPSPVGVASADDRKTALGYLFADEFAAAGPKLNAAKTATTLPQLLQAAQMATDLRQLEMAATGTDEKTKPEVAAIGDNAHTLIQTNLQTMTGRVADIRRSAETQSTNYQQQRTANGGMVNVPQVTKAGLTQANVTELKQIQATCQKIGPAADAFAKVSADTGGAGGSAGWDQLSAEATRTNSEAGDVLNANYGNGMRRH